MGLFDDNGGNDSSGMFADEIPPDPYATTELDDSPEDTEGSERLSQLRRLALVSLVFVIVVMGAGFLVNRLRANSPADDLARSGGGVPTTEDRPASAPVEIPDTSSAPGPSGSGSTLSRAINSVVLILVGDGNEFCASGSGFAVDDGSLIVTNNHVIESSPECVVNTVEILVTTDPSKQPEPRFFGEVLYTDSTTDLAVLRLVDANGSTGRMTPLKVSTRPVEVGETLQTIGFPGIGGFTVTVTQGNIAGFTSDDSGRWIKTDASISGGNSGGAAIDSNGEVIAVPTQAGGGGQEVVDCRDFDTNHDGQIDSSDSCIPIGGFLNLLRPAEYVARAIERAK